jgi:hypothetical protein
MLLPHFRFIMLLQTWLHIQKLLMFPEACDMVAFHPLYVLFWSDVHCATYILYET